MQRAGQRIQFWDGADQTGNGVVNGGTGTWNAANTNWTGAPGQADINDQWRSSVGVFMGTAGTVTVVGTQAFDTLQFSTTGYVLNPGAGGQLQLAGLSGTGTINTDNGVVATINAPIVNGSSQSLNKVGGGTLVLARRIPIPASPPSAGTLQLGNGGTTGSIVGNVVDNGVLAINRSNAMILAGVISGSGAFNQIGSGTTTLSNINTYTGATAVTAGGLMISAAGSITSNVTNNATFTNVGTVTGSLSNTGTATNTGTITNGLTNTGTVNAAGIVNGAIANNAGTFTTTGALTSNSTFTNAAGATLAVGAATYTLQGLLSNSGAVTVAGGATLNATTGGVTNNAGGTITVAAGGTVKDDLNNAGVVANNGAYVANVASNTGTVTNNSIWTGNVASNTGTINNNPTWTGTVSNAGTFNNNAGATVSGALSKPRARP